jgi:helix-turn-helix protein
MGVSELRKDLEEIRASARAGHLDQIVQTVDRALRALDRSRLLTTTEAAELLGIRSVNTLKMLVRQSGAPYELHGNRMMIPVSTLEELQQSQAVRGIRASDRAHDELGSGMSGAMTAEELRELSASRPGQLPWRQAKTDA